MKTVYRGINVTDEDVIQAMELFDRQFRSTFPEKRWVTYAIEHNGKLYPPKQILRIVRQAVKLVEVESRSIHALWNLDSKLSHSTKTRYCQ